MKKVSVLVPCYNMERFIREALESIFRQKYENIEAIIVNDGSTDSSEIIINDVIRNLQRPGLSYIYVYQDNAGLACARNIALANSTGDYIALLDPDDLWLPHHLSDCCAILDVRDDVVLVHANIIFIDEQGRKLGVPARRSSELSGHLFQKLITREAHISCPTAVFRKESLESVGWFDEYLTYLGCEDRDLWLRLAQKGTFTYLDREHACYRKVSGSLSSNIPKMEKARLYVLQKYVDKCSFRVKRKGLASVYSESAYAYQKQMKVGAAFCCFLAAVASWPLSMANWKMLCKTALSFSVKIILR